MENLTVYIMALIAIHIAPFGIQDLFSFMEVSRLHRYVGNWLDVIRVLPAEECIHLLSDSNVFPYKYYFINKLINSGHPKLCVAQAVRLLNLDLPQPDLAKFVLKEAIRFDPYIATYLSIILQVFFEEEFHQEQLVSRLAAVCSRQFLDISHQEILDAGGSNGSTTWRQTLKRCPPKLVLRVFFPEKEKCVSYAAHPRRFCYDCLLHYEVKWFVN